jgi:hypothetical protein
LASRSAAAFSRRGPQHHRTNGDHDEPEQKQQPIAVDELAEARFGEGA